MAVQGFSRLPFTHAFPLSLPVSPMAACGKRSGGGVATLRSIAGGGGREEQHLWGGGRGPPYHATTARNPRAGGATKVEAGRSSTCRRGDQAADGDQADGGDHSNSLPFSSSLSRSRALTSLGFSMPSFPSFKSRTTTASSNEVEDQREEQQPSRWIEPPN